MTPCYFQVHEFDVYATSSAFGDLLRLAWDYSDGAVRYRGRLP